MFSSRSGIGELWPSWLVFSGAVHSPKEKLSTQTKFLTCGFLETYVDSRRGYTFCAFMEISCKCEFVYRCFHFNLICLHDDSFSSIVVRCRARFVLLVFISADREIVKIALASESFRVEQKFLCHFNEQVGHVVEVDTSTRFMFGLERFPAFLLSHYPKMLQLDRYELSDGLWK